MDKRHEQATHSTAIEIMEQLSGKKVDEALYNQYTKGVGEEDLVNSGLEETMITAYERVRETMKKQDGKIDLRTAAFVGAINRMATFYVDMGIFP